jgi:type IV pilus assembly protein PilY1
MVLASAALLAFGTGPAVAAVQVDQSPLIVAEPLPPNIILMYDDSGSMGRNYMPDGAPQSGDDFRDSSQNRQYYNPDTLYTIPPRAESDSYPTPSFPNGYVKPFSSSSTVDILSDGSYSDGRAFVYFDGGVEHHVMADGGVCSISTNCHHASDPLEIDGVDTTYGQNVANFYSYYRQRDLAAKSGIMTAFSGLNPEYRVGFGSINNRGSNYIVNNANQSFYIGSKYLAGVDRFGAIDETGVQREKFWGWLEAVYSSGWTPLRQSLKAVGEYYDDQDQPWEGGYDEDGNYDSKQYSCRQSYAILLTDGYWNGNDPGVGNADGSDGSELVSADGKDTFKYEPKDPFEDGYSNTLADVAMEYWKRDLRPGDNENKNDVPTTGRDPAFWQHMTTFTIGLGVEPSGINPSDATIPAIFDWSRTGSEPTSFDASNFAWGGDKIADLAHAAVNGHGGFYSAADPQEFARGLSEALAAIDNASGAGNSVSLSTEAGEVVKDGSLSFVGKYVTGEWSGSLKAFSYSSSTGEFDAEEWSAAAQMPAALDRNIWTRDAGSVVEFKASELSSATRTALSDNIDTTFTVSGDDIVAYLRGDRSYENAQSTPLDSTLRQRASLLGDIVSSTPVPVGAPEPKASAFDFVTQDFDGLDEYADFVKTHKDREPMVYVASNDGMLHAFEQSTGEETFAFLPGSLLTASGDASLARYANPQYGVYDEVSGQQAIPHQYYNDGEMTTENVYINGAWKTVLVGTTGRGPTRTVYAIDVTDPSVLADPAKAANAVLWEHSAAEGGDYEWIGQVLGRPTIWQVPDNGNKTKWVALIGNGPNSGDDEAALLQFDLADGSLEVIETNNDKNNGLAAPTVIMTDPGTSIADYAFAGDLRGNVWQFDLDKGTSEKVFEAVGPAGDEQPITARMNATAHPNDGSIWLFFGTGRFLAEDDIDRREVQSLYGLRVQARTSGKPEVDATSTRGDDLVERSIVGQENNGDLVERATELGSENDLNPDKAGWYMDLIYDNNAEGERVLNIAQLVAGSLYVTTMIPIAGDPCNALPPGATMILDPFSGANPGSEFLALDGYGNLGSIGDVPVNAYITKSSVAGALTFAKTEAGETLGVAQNVSGETIDVPAPPVGAGGAVRLNWQELYVR